MDGEEPQLSEEENLERLRESFRKCDLNDDGFITIDEIYLLWDHLNLPVVDNQQQRVQEVFRFMDSDGNGEITFEEFVGGLSRVLELLKDVSTPEPPFGEEDEDRPPLNPEHQEEVFEGENNDNKLREKLRDVFNQCLLDDSDKAHRDHLRDMLVNLGFGDENEQYHINQAFDLVDQDQDGLLNFHEFEVGIKQVISLAQQSHTPTEIDIFEEEQNDVFAQSINEEPVQKPEPHPHPRTPSAALISVSIPAPDYTHKRDMRHLRNVFQAHDTTRRGYILANQLDEVWADLGYGDRAPDSLRNRLTHSSTDLPTGVINAISETAFVSEFLMPEAATPRVPAMPASTARANRSSIFTPDAPVSATKQASLLKRNVSGTDLRLPSNFGVKALQQEVDELKEALQNKDIEITHLNGQIAKANLVNQHTLRDSDEVIQKLEEKLRAEQELNERRHKELLATRAAKEELEHENETSIKRGRSRKGTSSRKDQQDSATIALIETLRSTNAKLTQENETAGFQLTEAALVEARLKQQIRDLSGVEREMLNIKTECDTVKKDYDDLQSIHEQTAAQNGKLQDEIDELREKLRESNDRRPTQVEYPAHADFQFEMEASQARAVALETISSADLEQHQKEIDELRSAMLEQRHKHAEDLKTIRADHERSIADLQGRANFLSSHNAQLSTALDEHRLAKEKANAELLSVSKALRELQSIHKSLSEANQRLQAELAEKNEEIDALNEAQIREIEDLNAEIQQVFEELKLSKGKDALALTQENSKLKKRILDLERFREMALSNSKTSFDVHGQMKSSFTELSSQVSELLSERKELMEHIERLREELEDRRETNVWLLKSEQSMRGLEALRLASNAKTKMAEYMASSATGTDEALISAYKLALKSRDERILELERKLVAAISEPVPPPTRRYDDDIVQQLIEEQRKSDTLFSQMKNSHKRTVDALHERIQELEQRNESLENTVIMSRADTVDWKTKSMKRSSIQLPSDDEARGVRLLNGVPSGIDRRREVMEMIQLSQIEKVRFIKTLTAGMERLAQIKVGHVKELQELQDSSSSPVPAPPAAVPQSPHHQQQPPSAVHASHHSGPRLTPSTSSPVTPSSDKSGIADSPRSMRTPPRKMQYLAQDKSWAEDVKMMIAHPEQASPRGHKPRAPSQPPLARPDSVKLIRDIVTSNKKPLKRRDSDDFDLDL